MSKSSTRNGRERTTNRAGSTAIVEAALVRGFVRIVIFIFDADVKRRAFRESEHRLAGLQRLDFREQGVFLPVDPFEVLFKPKLRSSERLQLAFLSAVA